MTETKTFIIDGESVEMTKEECHSKFSELYNKNADMLDLLKTLAASAERRGEREAARRYHREYTKLKANIDFYATQYLTWETA